MMDRVSNNKPYSKLGGMDQVNKYIWFSIVVSCVVVIDQITKALILVNLPLGDFITIIPGFFNLNHVHNPGGAFGLLAHVGEPWRSMLFFGAGLMALVLLLYFYHKTPRSFLFLRCGLSFIFGGAIGNLIDRIRFGEVVDFLDFYLAGHHYPTFNIADSAVSVGVAIFVFHIVFKKVPY